MSESACMLAAVLNDSDMAVEVVLSKWSNNYPFLSFLSFLLFFV